MIKKVQGFLAMMQKYSTPEGVVVLEAKVKGAAEKGMHELLRAVKKKVGQLVNQTLPEVENAIHEAVRGMSHRVSDMAAEKLAEPLGDILSAPLGDAVGKALDDEATGQELGKALGPLVGKAVAKAAKDVLSKELGEKFEDILEKALEYAEDALEEKQGVNVSWAPGSVSLVQLDDGSDDSVDEGSSLSELVEMLKALNDLLPTSTSSLKDARKEVSKVAKQMDTIFEIFQDRGPRTFTEVAAAYRMMWTLYYLFLAPLSLFILYYSFWAGGFFGGPQPLDDEVVAHPVTLTDKVATCFTSCCTCLSRFHDTELCFWSLLLLMQVIVLLIFIVSILLCILAGVKAFVISGCAQVYVLRDDIVCSEILLNLQQFLSTFFVADEGESMRSVCSEQTLLTCKTITIKMQVSTLLTTVFSLLATVFSLQLIIESGVLHEMARYRRIASSKGWS
mmetsp:Transcript_27875/g.60911  ORF Transcript_27875/g.60911 Transcript_27875/m.60911 type:complete len:449 (+) Transcript_27875:286-1632(+)